MSILFNLFFICFQIRIKEYQRAVRAKMSAIRHRPLGPSAPGDSDVDFSDNESSPLTQDIYGGR